ncbi:MAG: ribosome small subunit-dependent GTPase A [Firmicutes bacterium]|nr:ribosome small subunit-dependent GTPase A [Bacillota bacterium]
MEGIIVKNISNDYTVRCDNKYYICKPRGKFRKENISPLVGDIVVIDENNNYILEIKSRKNELVRPSVANVDQAVIIMSIAYPDFSDNLLDKLLVILEFNNIKPIICFTKLDLLKEEEKEEAINFINYYKHIGYDVYDNTQLDEIKKIFKNKLTVFTGQSGAGKSTLINKLNPNLNLKTDEISKALGRGKHTTRHVELIDLYGGLVADTPGFSSVSFLGMSLSDIRDSFIEFNKYRDECEYKDCMHDNESICEIKKQLKESNILESRYQNYLKFIGRR